GRQTAIDFPRPMINQKNYDFSFSGLKTAVLYYLRDNKNKNIKIEDVAASFQSAAFDVLINKTLKAAKEFRAKSIMISGGVASNFSLKKDLKLKIKNKKLKISVFIPPKKFCTDNAAIIAVAGYINYLQKKKHHLNAQGNLTI
ncbi:tRNA (adenosine(37)-N6)-threonylcarbamoyltransferase complex transferase subunit TsaD, partial [Candidatus Wolfebacteria bacterium CG_4_9_14_0_8_um_filter_39_46]